MTWINTETQLPEPNTDVLGLWWIGDAEMHVIALSSEGEWYRQMDHDSAQWEAPDSWMPLPEPPERPEKWRLTSEDSDRG